MLKLIFVHGFLGSSQNWSRVISKLKKAEAFHNVECHCLDLLWHSKNAAKNIAPTSSPLSSLMEDTCRQLENIEGPWLMVAHSFGLRPLLELVNRPLANRMRAWIVEDSAPELSAHGFAFLDDILSATPLPFINRKAASEFFLRKYSGDNALTQFLLSNLSDRENGEWVWRFNAPALRELLREVRKTPRWDAWNAFNGDLYLLHGARSKVLTPEVLKRCVEARVDKHIESVLFENSEHWLHFDSLDRFVAEIERIVTPMLERGDVG